MEVNEQWQNNSWLNDDKANYTYNTNGKLLTEIVEVWENNVWTNSFRNIFTYDINGNSLTLEEDLWQTNMWVNFSLMTSTYDINDYLLSQIDQEWKDNSWLNSHRFTFSYNIDGNSVMGEFEKWGNGNWIPDMTYINLYSQKIWIYSTGKIYRYEAGYQSFILGVPDLTNKLSFTIYPNPAKDKITLSIPQIQNNKNNVLTICDMQGKLLLQKNIHHEETEIDVNSLRKGLYLLKVTHNYKIDAVRLLKD